MNCRWLRPAACRPSSWTPWIGRPRGLAAPAFPHLPAEKQRVRNLRNLACKKLACEQPRHLCFLCSSPQTRMAEAWWERKITTSPAPRLTTSRFQGHKTPWVAATRRTSHHPPYPRTRRQLEDPPAASKSRPPPRGDAISRAYIPGRVHGDEKRTANTSLEVDVTGG